MKLIVSAADLAMTESITDGCIRAIREGILVDVGLMTNNYGYAKRAVEELKKYPHVCIGMDFNVVSGRPASDPKDIPSLVDEDGIFISSRLRRSERYKEADIDDIYRELEKQMTNFIELVGHTPAYVLGHSWTSPNLIKASKEICAKYDVKCNVSHDEGFEKDYGFIRPSKSWYFPDSPGVSDQRNDFNDANIQKDIDVVDFLINDRGELLKNEYSLFRNHCGYCDSELLEMSTFNIVRIKDMEALCSPKVKAWIEENDIEVITMKQAMDEVDAKRMRR